MDGRYEFTLGSIISCTIFCTDVYNINRILIWYHHRYNGTDTYIIEARELNNINSPSTIRTGVYVAYINSFNINPW